MSRPSCQPISDSRAVRISVSQQCHSGISPTGREARTIASVSASQMLLPLPFHPCMLSFCYVVRLLYALDLPISSSLWRALGATHKCLLHCIAEFTQRGCTNTVYLHGFSHIWFGYRLPIHLAMKPRRQISEWPKGLHQ